MNNLREVNDDILKDWIECRESTLFPFTNNEDKKHDIYFDEFFENILRNVPDQNKKYVKKQFDKIDDNFLDYICYWREKYYRNGFVDGVQLIKGCEENNIQFYSAKFALYGIRKARLILAFYLNK